MARGSKKEFASMSDAISSMSDKFPSATKCDIYPTGSLAFDKILAHEVPVDGKTIAGLPAGRMVELCSPAGYGKSTAALHFCKTFCKADRGAVYIDFENAVNQQLLDGMGISEFLGTKFALHKAADYGDIQTLLDAYLQVPDVGIIVIDSITAVMPDKLKSIAIDEMEPGLQARLSSNFYLKYKSVVAKSGKVLLIINQVRTKIDFKKGSEILPAGGQAQQFFMDIRIMMQKCHDIWTDRKGDYDKHDEGSYIEGVDLGIWTIKNKFAIPYLKAVASVLFGKGISNIRCVLLYCEEYGYIQVGAGGWYTITIPGFPETKPRGRLELENTIKENYQLALDFLKEQKVF